MRPAGLRFGAVIKKNRKYFVHGFPPFRGGCGLLRLRGFFLRGKLCGFCRFLSLNGVAGEQAAVDLKAVGVFLGDGRGNFGKVMFVGFDPAIQVLVQFFPAGKDFPILSGDLFPLVSVGRVGIKAPAERPRVGNRFLGGAVIPGILGNGVIHLVDHVAADMAVLVRGLPLVCGMGNGKRPGIFKGFVQKQGSSGLFLPCGGLFFQAVKHFLFCGGAFRPQGKKLCKGQLYRFGKIGLAAFKVNPALDPHSAGRF